ncbi:MAG: methyltransferase domain-containing protein [Terriglobales bacterium]
MSTQQTCLYDRYFSTQASRGNTPLELSAQWRYYDELTIRRAAITDPQARILELGCGYGRLLLTLRRLGFHNLRGVDLSQEQVQLAGELGLDCVVRGDALSFLQDAPPGEADAVFALDVLEHLSKDNLLELVAAVYRALKPGGRFVVHVPNGEAIFSGRIVYGDLTHQTAFTQTSMAQLLTIGGFEKIRCFEDQPIIHGPVSLVRNVAWRVIRLGFKLIALVETGSGNLLLSQNLTAIAAKPR